MNTPTRSRFLTRPRVAAALLLLCSGAPTLCLAATLGAIAPGGLHCVGLVNPEGIDEGKPTLSWISTAAASTQRGQVQTAYQILVADSATALGKDAGNVWDSGRIVSDQSTYVAYAGKPLTSHQRCFWKVRLWDRDGGVSAWSQPAEWTMGFVAPDKWQPEWVCAAERTPLLRKEFTLAKPVQRAWVYASALGLYELRLNGNKVGPAWLAPGWTDYRQRVRYQRFDVTDLVKNGANVMGAEIAPGWFAGTIGNNGKNHYGKTPAFAAELYLLLADGSTQIVKTDGTWKTNPGSRISSDIMDGEAVDARLDQTGWDQPGYQDSGWKTANILKGRVWNLIAQKDEPIGVVQEIGAVKVTEPAPRVFVYDLGQNITGVARISLKGPEGTMVTVNYAERINTDGTLDVTNLKLSKSTDTYVMSGIGTEVFEPKFTFHGFRWISIKGLDKAPALTAVTGVVLSSRFPETGTLKTSNPALNHLLSNIKWTIRNTYISVPLDSAQRSERKGWTGDANVMAATANWFFDVNRFQAKWETDILHVQSYSDNTENDGAMPNGAPKWGTEAGKGGRGIGGGWGDAGVNVPYVLWKRYGNTDVIRSSYQGMKKWIGYLERNSQGHIIPVKARISTAGDWESDNDETPKDLVGTFYYALDLHQLTEMADAIGETADAAAFRKQFQEVGAAIIKEFVSADGTVAKGSQTAQVFALYLGLYPDGMKDKVLGKLIENVEKRDYHISTGYLGSQWLLHVLDQNGRADVAYKILLQPTRPSWLFMASNGQTSLWEGWTSLNEKGEFDSVRTSLGHSALGSCGDWMFQKIGGLVPDPASPGFKHFTIQPVPGGGLTHAELSYQSPYGPITSQWSVKDGRFTLDVNVPVNTTAIIVLPTTDAAGVTEGGRPVASSPGVTAAGVVQGALSYRVGSGRYMFTALKK